MLRIEFRGEMIDEISKHALREYPHECCGALLGLEMDGTRYVTAATPIDNVTGDDRRRRFSIAPR
jgi:proteasome lid subunit RPN8/RPN11